MEKLDWNYDNDLGCEVAMHNGYRIKAERDDSPENPFENEDGHWPTMIYHGRNDGFSTYDKVKGVSVDAPLDRFNDAHLIHDQKAIAQVLGAEPTDLDQWLDYEGESPKWVTDASVLRVWFEDAIGNVPDSRRLATFRQLYKLLGVPCYQTTSTGYCQGDWAEVLVVATPEAAAEFGCKEVTDSDLEGTADLYGYWAWGDVYGYVIEKPIFDEDGDIEDWEDACEHNSCWGYYGTDHDKSGLEEAALECVPDEPVRAPDNKLEAA